MLVHTRVNVSPATWISAINNHKRGRKTLHRALYERMEIITALRNTYTRQCGTDGYTRFVEILTFSSVYKKRSWQATPERRFANSARPRRWLSPAPRSRGSNAAPLRVVSQSQRGEDRSAHKKPRLLWNLSFPLAVSGWRFLRLHGDHPTNPVGEKGIDMCRFSPNISSE